MEKTGLPLATKLNKVQYELKAPKGQYNKFGNYNYRSCEDIVESVKPILNNYGLTLIIGDEIVLIGERYYIKATATIYNAENITETISVSAYAREPQELKGMVESQITGSASSYARKYALNGLFAIDDTKDFDTNEATIEKQEKQKVVKTQVKKEVQQPTQTNEPLATKEQTDYIASFGEPAVKWVFAKYKIDALSKLTLRQATEIIDGIKKGNK